MEQKTNIFLVLALVAIVAVAFLSSKTDFATGQLVVKKPADQDVKLPTLSHYFEIKQGETFVVPASGSPNGYELVEFVGADPINQVVALKGSWSGVKEFTYWAQPDFFGNIRTTIVYSGESLDVQVNDHPTGQRLYINPYVNRNKIVRVVSGTSAMIAFSETNACGNTLSCNFFQPEVGVITNIDTSNQLIDIDYLFPPSNPRSFTYDKQTGNVFFIVAGQTYQARVVSLGGNTYGIELVDPKFHVFGPATDVSICYYK